MKTIVYSLPLLCMCSFSQAGELPQDDGIETIKVTAQGKLEAIDDIPMSIHLLSGEQLEQFSIDSFEHLTENTPGVFISKNSGATKMYIRGIGAQGNAGLDQALSIYYDDIYYGRSRNSKGMLVDIERVELLKGPQSIYFGLNASAGAIAVHSRKPNLSDNQGYIVATGGQNNLLATRFGYNHVLSDKWAVRIAGEKSDSDGPWTMLDNNGNPVGDGGGEDSHLLRLSTLYSPNEQFSATLKLETQKLKKNNPFAWQPGGCDNLYALGLSSQQQLNDYWQNTGSTKNNPLKVPATCSDNFVDSQFDEYSPASPLNDSSYQNQALTLLLQWQWDNLYLNSISGYVDSDYGFSGNDLSHGTNAHRLMWSQDNDRQFSQHIKLYSDDGKSDDGNGNGNGNDFDFLLGAYWHSNHVDFQTADVDGRSANNLQFSHAMVQQQSYSSSLYGAVDWYLTDKFELNAGVRYERTVKHFDARDYVRQHKSFSGQQKQDFIDLLLADTNGNPEAYQDHPASLRSGFSGEKAQFSHLMPSIALKYQLNPNTLMYYKISKGQKSGGFNFRLNSLDDDTLTYDSERTTAHELGIKQHMLDDKLRFSAAVFDSDYRDLQQNSNRDHLGNNASAVIRNAAQAHSRGIELEANWQALQSVTIGLWTTWLDAEFDDYQGADCSRLQAVVVKTDVAEQFGAQAAGSRGCFQDLSGKSLPMAPKFASKLSIEHQMMVGSYNINTQLQWFYSDGFYTSPHADKLRYQGAFDKFHLRVEVHQAQSNWYFALLGYNLSNELTARQLGQDGNAAVSGLLDQPRHVQFQIKYNF